MKFILHRKVISLLGLLLLFVSCEISDEQQSADAEEMPFSAAYIDNDTNPENPEQEELDHPALPVIESITESRTNAITNAIEQASNAVVSIMATEEFQRFDTLQDELFRFFFGDQTRQNTSMGSGFIISEDGLVVTNQHVIGNNPREIIIVTTMGETFEGKLIGSDELTDLALIQIESESAEVFDYVEFSDSDEIIVGEWAIALGNPFGLFEDGKPTVTVGVVSAINRDFRPNPNHPRIYIDMIQTDAAINRGNSGGPLLNSEGKVIGVNTFIYTGGTSAGFVGLSFAIPSNRVDRIISQLLASGSVTLDYDPGMEFTSMTEQLIYRYRLPYVRGLLGTSVNKSGPAYECGILPGDVIVKIGAERVISEMHAWALLRDYEQGDTMYVELLRDNDLYKTEMILRQKISAD
jgi:serine protease Do